MILIIGATGTIGHLLVRALAARGTPIRALVRDAAKGDALGCPYVVGDLDRPDTLVPALAGVDQVFLNASLGASFVAQQTAAIDAAVAAGVSRIVRVSSAGAGADSALAMGRWHAALDAHLAASGVAWIVLRPGAFMQNLLRSAPGIRQDSRIVGAYQSGRVAFIDAEDIAACAAAVLGGTGSAQTFALTGGEALTYAEVAARLSALLGRPIAYVDVPVEQIVGQAAARGFPPELARDFGLMMTSIAEQRSIAITSTVRDLLGRAPRTLDQFLATHAAAFR